MHSLYLQPYCVALELAMYPPEPVIKLVSQSSLNCVTIVYPAVIIKTRAGPNTTLAPVGEVSTWAHHKDSSTLCICFFLSFQLLTVNCRLEIILNGKFQNKQLVFLIAHCSEKRDKI